MILRFRSHHIGVLVKDVALATETYVSSLGYEIRSDIIHDARQTANVRFLALPGDSVLLELVAPDGPESRLSRSLKAAGGINHICYEIDNIESAIEVLRGRKFMIIEEPVEAAAFNGRRIAWMMNRDHLLIELVEKEK